MLRIVIERYAKLDLDPLARHAHAFDDEPKESLPLRKVEAVERRSHPAGEVVEPLAQAILLGQFGSLHEHAFTLDCESVLPGLDFCDATLEFVEFQKSSLVGIDQSPALLRCLLELAFQVGELTSQEIVISGGESAGDNGLACEQHVRSQQGLPNVLEHQLIQCVGPWLALLTDPIATTCGNWVVLVAAVVANEAPPARCLEATHGAPAAAALDEAAEQVGPGLSPSRAPLRVSRLTC